MKSGSLGLVAVGTTFSVFSTMGCGSSESPGETEDIIRVEIRLETYAHVFEVSPTYRSWVSPGVQGLELKVRGIAPDKVAVPEAQVALVGPDGQRMQETLADAEGIAAFDVRAEDWPADARLAVTAYKLGFYMHSRVGLARPEGNTVDWTVLMQRPYSLIPSAERITITGKTQNARGPRVAISTLTRGGSSGDYGQSHTWRLEGTTSSSLELLAFDYIEYSPGLLDVLGMASVRHDGMNESGYIDVDFEAHSVGFTTRTGSFGYPARQESPARDASAERYVSTFPRTAFAGPFSGLTTRLRSVAGTNRVEFSVAMSETTDPSETWFYYKIFPRSGGFTFGGHLGVPEGTRAPLMDLPEFVGVAPEAPVGNPVRWEVFDDVTVRAQVHISTASDEGSEWIIDVPTGVTEVLIPAPPSTVDLVDLLHQNPHVRIELQEVGAEATSVGRVSGTPRRPISLNF